jgi:hypothetical protein
MSAAEYAFLVAQIFIARGLTPFTAFVFGMFWLLLAAYRGW